MSAVLNAYMNENERTLMQELVSENMKFRQLQTMYEMVNLDMEMKLANAEDKVFLESGTYDDLDQAIMEAAEEVAQKKGNILSKMISFIVNQFNKITNFITEKLSGKNGKTKDDNEEVKVQKSFLDKINIFKKADQMLSDAKAKFKSNKLDALNDVSDNKWKQIVAGITATAAGTAIATVTTLTIKKYMNDSKNISKNISDAMETAEKQVSKGDSLLGAASKVGEFVGGKAGAAVNKASELGGRVMDVVKSLLKKFKDLGTWLRQYIDKLASFITSGSGNEESGEDENKVEKYEKYESDGLVGNPKIKENAKKAEEYREKQAKKTKRKGNGKKSIHESADDTIEIFGYSLTMEDADMLTESTEDAEKMETIMSELFTMMDEF